MQSKQTAAILLAAGAAARMGELKQLMPYRGRPLVQHAIEQARLAGFTPVIVVAGAEFDRLVSVILSCAVEIARNANWQAGMGSSIVTGLQHLDVIDPNAQSVALVLGDQPLIMADHLRAMREQFVVSTATAVAAQYSGVLGAPALFKREAFQALRELKPEIGARHLLRHAAFAIEPFPLPEGVEDLDTPEDYARITAAARGHT